MSVKRKLLAICGLVGGLVIHTSAPTLAQDNLLCARNIIHLQSEKGVLSFSVEIADTEDERTLGLMMRPYLPVEHGMLFVWDDAAPRSFWMRETRLSLDILFIGPNGYICNIAEKAEPMSETSIPSDCDAQYVLEINAGLVAALGIRPNTRVQNSAIPNSCKSG